MEEESIAFNRFYSHNEQSSSKHLPASRGLLTYGFFFLGEKATFSPNNKPAEGDVGGGVNGIHFHNGRSALKPLP